MADVSLLDHYDRPDLSGRILAALRDHGLDPDRVGLDDLALLDEFHIRGADATRELAELAALDAGTEVLDLGSGLGGPARRLAAGSGCRVVGLDLVESFCTAATMLTGLVGLAERVSFRVGDMRDLPFADASFDRVWFQHTLANVADKATVAAETARVLRPDGRVLLYEVCRGDGGPVHLPVPWASAPGHSHLATADDLLDAFASAGFTITHRSDATGAAIAWLDGLAQAPRPAAGTTVARPNLGLVMGPDAGAKSRNLARNLRERRVTVLVAVGDR